ncbi:MAG: hypothetical protein HFE86_09425 [Clostridiales bacterium]|nr:hypothetical protein [Clostridiales bacterium]
MAEYTPNYNLKKPALGDFIYITDLNQNADTIDAVLAEKADADQIGKIFDGTVTTEKLDNGAVTGAKLDSQSVTTEKLADNSVSSDKIQALAIGPLQLAPSAVVGSKLMDGAVTAEKLADRAVTAAKLADGLLPENPATAPAALTQDRLLLGGGGMTVKAGDYTVEEATEGAFVRFTVTGPSGVTLTAPAPSSSCTLSLKARCVSSEASDPQFGPMINGSYYWDGSSGYLSLPPGGGWASAKLSGITNTSSMALFFYNAGTYDIQEIKLTDGSGNDILDHAAFQAQGTYHDGRLDTSENRLIPTLERVEGLLDTVKNKLPTASTSQAGLVQLSNTLTSSSTTQALTAAQGKALRDSMPKYGTCSTAAGTAAKTVSIDSFQLTANAMVAVKFTSGSTAASPTLNINGTGAKYIYQNGDIARNLTINAKQTVLFIYDGSCYRMIDVLLPNPTKVSSLVIGSGTASETGSFAQGFSCEASTSYSHAEGMGAIASGNSSHAEGGNTIASGLFSHAEGSNTTASGSYSHASGYYTTAPAYSFVLGKYNKTLTAASSETSSTGDAFVVGNGTSNSNLKNAFRVSYSGDVYTTKTYTSSGADYAEYFEWVDGNPDGEDRTGLFVTLDGENIRLATAADTYILGAVSAAPSVVGDAASEDWHGRYLTDVYGRVIKEQKHFDAVTETVHHKAEKDTDGNILKEAWDETIEIEPAHDDMVWAVNPDYDPKRVYIPREQRPEYAPIGILGKLVVRDDGSCQAGGFCYPGADGIGTAADSGYRVMSRIDKTHVKIVLK